MTIYIDGKAQLSIEHADLIDTINTLDQDGKLEELKRVIWIHNGGMMKLEKAAKKLENDLWRKLRISKRGYGRHRVDSAKTKVEMDVVCICYAGRKGYKMFGGYSLGGPSVRCMRCSTPKCYC